MKGQVFTLDLILGMLIISTTIVGVVFFLPDNPAPFTDDANKMRVLMTEGLPSNWTNETVIIPGLLSNNRFNTTKIEYFNNFTYKQQKKLLNVQSDFNMTFYDNQTQVPVCLACGTTVTDYDELLPIKRYALLESNVTRMEVHLYK